MKQQSNVVTHPSVIDSILEEAKSLESYIIEKRRDFHRHPELGFEEVRTSAIVRHELEQRGFQTVTTAKTGVVGTIGGGAGKPCVVLRADMDALALTEENDCSYRSEVKGKMHACGHDAHVAMLLAASQIISKHTESLGGMVKCIFQPAEEGGGGGRNVCEEGHLDGVSAAFAMHVWVNLASGILASRNGPFFANSNELTITICGKGGHAAYPSVCVDPTAVGVDIYNALQKVISREISPFVPAVISLTKMQGSQAHNIIPEQMVMQGTVRSFDDSIYDFIMKRIDDVVTHYAAAWRCEGVASAEKGHYPVLHNDPAVVSIGQSIAALLGPVEEAQQTMGGEDFAFYSKKCPCAMFLLGVGNKEKGIAYPHHHPRFDIDESVLWKGAAFYAL
ncbi:MAG: amidohydrolase, partial [Chitinivibrionales bacterium]|nr:amidohydrolase [Chitinivibrionales bacterium]